MINPTRLKGRTSPGVLADRIRQGDRRAEAEFCYRYRDSVHALLLGLCRDVSRADDVTQDALLTVLIKLRGDGIDHPERLTSYVHQTARFTLISNLRKAPRYQFQDNMDQLGTMEPLEQDITRDEQRDLINNLIGTLEVERDREVLFRSYICDENKASVCDALALTATHFDRVISRARLRLRRVIEDQIDNVHETLAV